MTSEVFYLVRPVLLAGVANALLFFSVDRTQPWTVISAVMGMALLGAVLTRQLNQILSLEREVAHKAEQLSVFTEIVSSLNTNSNLGNTLGTVLDRLRNTMQADTAAIWLPAADENGRLMLVEERGLPDPEQDAEILHLLEAAVNQSGSRLLRHTMAIEGIPTGEPSARCLTVRMGWEGEDLGYISLMKWTGEFTDAEGAILSAVGNDIAGALRSIRLLSEARRLADKDPVTGLFNHRTAYRRLHTELERHIRVDKPMSVLMMDLDNFKLFNDTYGHPAGDEVLKRVSGLLRKSCRETDTVARYGGDEFLVILPETALRQAVRCAERIQANLARERFRCEDSAPLPIGFSYGIASFPDDAREVMELVSIADANLYQSKTAGGNQITARGSSPTDNGLVYVKGFDLFRAMVAAIDNKDGYTRKHSEEVTAYSLEIAKAMELGDEMLQTIQVSGLLHDVGKIGVPDHILRKPGRLTDEEFNVMQQHPVFGALIVGAIPGMDHVVLGVRHHHERYDGRGYPDRLAGDQIPLIGRIMAVADAYSAMTTSRPYRKGLTERQSLGEIQKGLGTQFDPEIGALFIRLRESGAEKGGEVGDGTAVVPVKTKGNRRSAAPKPDGAKVGHDEECGPTADGAKEPPSAESSPSAAVACRTHVNKSPLSLNI